MVDQLCGIIKHEAGKLELEPADAVQQRPRLLFSAPCRSVQRLNGEGLTASRGSDKSLARLALQSSDPSHEALDSPMRSLFNHENRSIESIN